VYEYRVQIKLSREAMWVCMCWYFCMITIDCLGSFFFFFFSFSSSLSFPGNCALALAAAATAAAAASGLEVCG